MPRLRRRCRTRGTCPRTSTRWPDCGKTQSHRTCRPSRIQPDYYHAARLHGVHASSTCAGRAGERRRSTGPLKALLRGDRPAGDGRPHGAARRCRRATPSSAETGMEPRRWKVTTSRLSAGGFADTLRPRPCDGANPGTGAGREGGSWRPWPRLQAALEKGVRIKLLGRSHARAESCTISAWVALAEGATRRQPSC